MAMTRLCLHQKMMEVAGQDMCAKKRCGVDFLREHFQTNGNVTATKALETYMRQHFFHDKMESRFKI